MSETDVPSVRKCLEDHILALKVPTLDDDAFHGKCTKVNNLLQVSCR
jgi:hypothetical protein